MIKQPKIRDKKHLDFIRSLPCLKTGKYGCEATHLRVGTDGGTSLKPSDSYTLPLTHDEHTLSHSKGERTFYNNREEKAKELCAILYEHSGDYTLCNEAIRIYRESIWYAPS